MKLRITNGDWVQAGPYIGCGEKLVAKCLSNRTVGPSRLLPTEMQANGRFLAASKEVWAAYTELWEAIQEGILTDKYEVMRQRLRTLSTRIHGEDVS